MERSEASRDADEVLRHALAGHEDEVAGRFGVLVSREGAAGAYRVAWCLAASAVGRDLPPGRWILDFPGIEDAGYETRWVARFLSAYANGDLATGSALLQAAEADGLLYRCLETLAGSAAATVRHRRLGAATR